MSIHVGVQVEEFDISNACGRLGLPVDTPKSGVIRAALAYLANKPRHEIENYANPRGENRLTVKTRQVKADIPDDLAEITLADTGNKSLVIRTALIMSAGYSREQAEAMATMKRGRPRKTD